MTGGKANTRLIKKYSLSLTMYWLFPVLIYEGGPNSFSDFPIESLDPSFLPHLKWCSELDEPISALNKPPLPKAELAKSKL